MRVSYQWLKEYLPLDVPVEELAELLTGLGLEVSAVEHVESIRGGLHGVVAGKVLTCVKHPNADRLSLTTVDIGETEPLQIVCGAPNIAAGQTVWVAIVGTTLYPYESDEPFHIGKAKVRGEVSEGMICAEDELGLGTDHSGILILPDGIATGTPATEYYAVTSDDVFDIELTPNRSDAICHLGVAKDLAAWFNVHGKQFTLQLPAIPPTLEKVREFPVTVEVRNTEACPRYCGVTISDVTIAESPAWLQNRLRTIGVKPINNVVDITNFVLHEMGQPLHAFDAEKIDGNHVIVETLAENTPFVTLDGVERKLRDTDLMICDMNEKGMCIAGVYGGIGTGISENTRHVFLESAHFNPLWIRRTSMYHDLRTDAARTFEKTTDPNICRDVLLRAASLMIGIAGGKCASDLVDIYPQPVNPDPVPVRWEMVNRLLGVPITKTEIREILLALGMQIVGEDEDVVRVTVPTNKADVTREADVIEEILRIYGYDRVELAPQLKIPLDTVPGGVTSALRNDLGNFLASRGFMEMMGLSFVESRQFEEGPLSISGEARIQIDNTSNAHLDLMRHNLLVSAVDAVRFNQNRMQHDLLLFEFGRTYTRQDEEIVETEHLTLSVSGMPVQNGWQVQNPPADFYFLKKFVHLVLDYLGIGGMVSTERSGQQWKYAWEYAKDGQVICTFGRISDEVGKRYDLKQPLYFADFRLSALKAFAVGREMEVQEISRFPAVNRDIAIVVGTDVSYSGIESVIRNSGGQLLTDCKLFDIYENPDALGAGKRSLALALTFQHPERTLTDEEVNATVQSILKALEKQTGATLR